MDHRTPDLGTFCHRELTDLVCGRRLGAGCFRTVFECELNSEWVVKVASGDYEQPWVSHNILEWETWLQVRGSKWESWFAPCHFISPFGAMLIQQRTAPTKTLPARVPNMFRDFKSENFGMIDGRFVVHDYGFTHLMRRGLNATRLIKTEKCIRISSSYVQVHTAGHS